MGLNTLHDFFTKSNSGEHPVFLKGQDEYSFKDVAALVRKYTRIVQSFAEEECILHATDSLLFIIGFFAVLHAGKRVVLAGNLRPNTLETLGSGPVLSDQPLPGACLLDFEAGKEQQNLKPFDPRSAYVHFFSSGSTGTPKRIPKTFHSLYEELQAVEQRLGSETRNGTTTLITVNLFHLYGMTFGLLYSMAKGFRLDTAIIRTPEELEERLALHSNTFLVSSPAFLDRLGRYQDNYSFAQKPYLITSSGGPLSQAGALAGRELLGTSPVEIFGSTETGVVGNRRQLEDAAWTLFPLVSATTGEDGRILVSSSFMDDREVLLGDSAAFMNERQFVLKGRADRLVKIEEHRISLPELEQALQSHPYVAHSICIPVTGKSGRTRIGACISLSGGGRSFQAKEGKIKLAALLKEYLRECLEPLGIPARWRFVDEIPRNEQGKIKMAEIQGLLSSKITEPIVLEQTELGAGKKELLLVFPKDSIYFAGHFPSAPILPGVVQVHFAVHFSGFGKDFSEMSKLKFSRVIVPDKSVKLTLELVDSSLAFTYSDNEGIFSKGVLRRV